jgi:ABC-type polysaccharide/polyol phosphate export permease
MTKRLIHIIRFFIHNRYLIYSLVKHDLTINYTGSWLGFAWNIIHPLVLVSIYWFIFSFGLRVQPVSGAPFLVWLVVGITIWFSFSEIVNGSTYIIVNNAYLVKKIIFPYHILPLIKIISTAAFHAFYLALIITLLTVNHIGFHPLNLQFIYYYICMSFLALGLGLMTSALNIFIRDVSQITTVMLQLFFWGTPIFWDINIMPKSIQRVLAFNPVYYLVQGYRDAFIFHVPFWEKKSELLVFWMSAGVVFIFGLIIFQKLKKHFAEVI